MRRSGAEREDAVRMRLREGQLRAMFRARKMEEQASSPDTNTKERRKRARRMLCMGQVVESDRVGFSPPSRSCPLRTYTPAAEACCFTQVPRSCRMQSGRCDWGPKDGRKREEDGRLPNRVPEIEQHACLRTNATQGKQATSSDGVQIFI